ncbi:trans-sulfuration enzyme family protein [Tistrella mobilis]
MFPHSDPWTLLSQAAVTLPEGSVPIAPPLYQTAAFSAEDAGGFARMATTPMHEGFYTRYGNPTTRALEQAVAALEGGPAAVATASGMGAITAVLLAFAGAGDHIVAQRLLYGGTTGLLTRLAPRLGITVDLVDQEDTAAFARAARPNTRLILLESPSNPLLRLTDLAGVAAFARNRGIVTMIDNTIATPLNQRPLGFGIDLVMHSATKYLSGHGDVSAGIITGRADLVERVWQEAHLLGATPDPFAAWLVLRGLRTLPMRVARQSTTALAVARHLAAHPRIAAVHYPGLDGHPQRDLARRQMPDGAGGLLSFEVAGGLDAAEAMMSRLRLIRRSASFGTPMTVAVHPAAMWSAMMTPDQLTLTGLPAGLIRLGLGFEDPAAIIADLDAALG